MHPAYIEQGAPRGVSGSRYPLRLQAVIVKCVDAVPPDRSCHYDNDMLCKPFEALCCSAAQQASNQLFST